MDGSSGCLRSSSKFLAGIETYGMHEISNSFANLFFVFVSPSIYADMRLQGGRLSPPWPFGMRRL